jgi:hypothetical protein
MARGRMINKKISNSKRVNDMPLQAQLLFTWLIPHLDCNGCFYGSAQMIKSLIVPRKNWTKNQIEKWLLIMEASKNLKGIPLICRYTVDSEQYLFMPGFKDEQIGLRYDKEKPEFPTFDGKDTENVGGKGKGRGRGSRREVEEESNSLSIEEIITLYKKMMGFREEESLDEEVEKDISITIERFSAAWVIDALQKTINQSDYRKHHWGYVVGILETWRREEQRIRKLGKGGRRLVPKGTYDDILAEHQRRVKERFRDKEPS